MLETSRADGEGRSTRASGETKRRKTSGRRRSRLESNPRKPKEAKRRRPAICTLLRRRHWREEGGEKMPSVRVPPSPQLIIERIGGSFELRNFRFVFGSTSAGDGNRAGEKGMAREEEGMAREEEETR